MNEDMFDPKPPFTVVVFDQWDHDCPGWELAVRENLEEAIVIAKEFNDNGIMKAGGVEKWLGFTDGALVYGSNNALAFNGIEDARVRHGYKGLNFFSEGKDGKEG
ncbi:MAG TPA: hypothetical protein PKJ37_10570 [Acidobacteriota bacterium]|nr:hypothetical protein [Acidobacteriota bacterium]HNT18320.1 hypothetical protein [Acidobacteriota bacterium]